VWVCVGGGWVGGEGCVAVLSRDWWVAQVKNESSGDAQRCGGCGFVDADRVAVVASPPPPPHTHTHTHTQAADCEQGEYVKDQMGLENLSHHLLPLIRYRRAKARAARGYYAPELTALPVAATPAADVAIN